MMGLVSQKKTQGLVPLSSSTTTWFLAVKPHGRLQSAGQTQQSDVITRGRPCAHACIRACKIYEYIHYITLHYITLHYTTLYDMTLHYMTWQDRTLHYITYIGAYIHEYIHEYITFYYITTYDIALYCMTLHDVTLHYIHRCIHTWIHYITLRYVTLRYIHTSTQKMLYILYCTSYIIYEKLYI